MIELFSILLVNITGMLSFNSINGPCEISFPIAYLSEIQELEKESFPKNTDFLVESNTVYGKFIYEPSLEDPDSNITKINFSIKIKSNYIPPPFTKFSYKQGPLGKKLGLDDFSGTKAEFLALSTEKVNSFLTYDGSYSSMYLSTEEIINEKKGTNYEYAVLLNSLLQEANIDSSIVYGYIFKNYWIPHVWVIVEDKYELDPTLGESFRISQDRFILSKDKKSVSYKGQLSPSSLKLIEKINSINEKKLRSWISYEDDSILLNIENQNNYDDLITYSFQSQIINKGHIIVKANSITKVKLEDISRLIPGEGTFFLYYRIAGEDKKATIKRKLNFKFFTRELSKAILSPFSALNNT